MRFYEDQRIHQFGFPELRKDMKQALLYHSIVKVEEVDGQTGRLILDDGTRLIVIGNEGCGGCGNGWFYLTKLNTCENMITDVKCSDDFDDGDEVFSLFVYSVNQPATEVLRYEGYDNGYYGTGYRVYVEIEE